MFTHTGKLGIQLTKQQLANWQARCSVLTSNLQVFLKELTPMYHASKQQRQVDMAVYVLAYANVLNTFRVYDNTFGY